jgi:beta-1,4-mannosyl-glycoprotein beta-1,4-N-acetylglucosaminyltransferase
MIYDCFQFFNELDLLDLRLNTLDPVVDNFVISESTVTFSGDPKPLYYDENKNLFRKFHHKIIHNVVSDTPDVNPFERDVFQKNAVSRALDPCRKDDIIIFSDLDEVPNPATIKKLVSEMNEETIYHFAQRQFYFYLNLEEISGNLLSFTGEFPGSHVKRWLGTKLFRYSFISDKNIGETRSPEMKECGKRIDEGGWHFTYMGGGREQSIEDRVAHKIKSAAHQEFNNNKILKGISKKIRSNKDIFGRNAKFEIVQFDNSYPEYLLSNLEKFEHLIAPKKKGFEFFKWLQR